MITTLLLLLPSARAACGLDACPLEDSEPPAPLQLQLEPRRTAAPDGAAWYAEQRVGAWVTLGERVTLGASASLVEARDAYGLRVGLGDSLIGAELTQRQPERALGVGVQLELPTATHRLTPESHWVALPYGRAQLWRGAWDLRARGGWTRAFGEDADHKHPSGHLPEVEVNPHGDSELGLRLEPGRTWRGAEVSVRPGMAAELSQALDAGERPRLTAGPTAELRLDALTLRAWAELPALGAPRFDHRVGLLMRVDLPQPRRSTS